MPLARIIYFLSAEQLELLNLCRDLEVQQRLTLTVSLNSSAQCLDLTAPANERRRFMSTMSTWSRPWP